MPNPEASLNNSESRARFQQKLFELGYKVPESPDSRRTKPNRILLRGEPINSRLRGNLQSEFHPQPGEWGRYGVFMGDCIRAAVYPTSGALYVIDRNTLGVKKWVVTNVDEYNRLMEKVGRERGYDITKHGGGIETELIISKENPVYDPKNGIVTVPNSVALRSVKRILVTPDYEEKAGIKISSLPAWLRKKIVVVR